MPVQSSPLQCVTECSCTGYNAVWHVKAQCRVVAVGSGVVECVWVRYFF